MQSAVRKIGNSAGVILPKPVLEALGAELGDKIDFATENGRVVVTKVNRQLREGWEEASKRLGEVGLTEEDKEWLEAPLNAEADSEWEW